jgi:hypothetical protein
MVLGGGATGLYDLGFVFVQTNRGRDEAKEVVDR